MSIIRPILTESLRDHNCYYEKIGNSEPVKLEDLPFDIPDSWTWIRIKEYVKKVTDFVASGSFASLRENVTYYKTENYALMVKTQDFQNNFTSDLTYTEEHGYSNLENKQILLAQCFYYITLCHILYLYIYQTLSICLKQNLFE